MSIQLHLIYPMLVYPKLPSLIQPFADTKFCVQSALNYPILRLSDTFYEQQTRSDKRGCPLYFIIRVHACTHAYILI